MALKIIKLFENVLQIINKCCILLSEFLVSYENILSVHSLDDDSFLIVRHNYR